MSETKSILVVDDHEATRRLLREVLEKDGYAVTLAASGEEAVRILKKSKFMVVISDIRMATLDGIAVLRESKKSDASTVVLLMTGFGSMEGAVEAIREGAFDYISKPFKIEALRALVLRATKHGESLRSGQNSQIGSGKLDVSGKGLIGKSPKIVEVYKTLARAAMSSSTVLVQGESGTGKELVAHAIHENSQRKKGPFVPVNCGSLPESLLESELFGHVKGAFTGSVGEKRGLFEEANGGTLFLDEIGDVTPALQIRLLRVLQEGEIKPVGSNETRKIDVRVIAATHRDLEALVRSGKFREDLYYRLKVIAIELPPLRSRMEDLPELIHYFLSKYAEKNKKAVSHVSDEAMALLGSYLWPGNVRELEHAIERAVALTGTSVLYPEDFPPEIARPGTPVAVVTSPSADGASSLEEMEKAHILKVLQDVAYNKSKASEVLGIDRATLYRKAQRYGIDLRGK